MNWQALGIILAALVPFAAAHLFVMRLLIRDTIHKELESYAKQSALNELRVLVGTHHDEMVERAHFIVGEVQKLVLEQSKQDGRIGNLERKP